MGIEINSEAGNCKVRIDGEMTIYTAAEYRQTLLEQCHSREGMELDLGEVNEIDTSGLQLLVALKKHLSDTESGLQLTSSSEVVQKALVLANLVGDFIGQTGDNNT